MTRHEFESGSHSAKHSKASGADPIDHRLPCISLQIMKHSGLCVPAASFPLLLRSVL